MSLILSALRFHARCRPSTPALCGIDVTIDYASLLKQVKSVAADLHRDGIRVLALMCDNSPAWAIVDLAAQAAGIVLLPLPDFFSPEQLRHAIETGGADAALCDDGRPLADLVRWDRSAERVIARRRLTLLRRRVGGHVPLPPGTARITFTSGTTGRPKGVCLPQSATDTVAGSLALASRADRSDRHLSCLPLATLLENVGGIHVPLLVGACSHLVPLAEVGLSGASGFDPMRMIEAIDTHQADTTILVPAQLEGLIAALASNPDARRLHYLAVGGAVVSPRLLQQAAALGLPVYQGYGLSECASVLAVNRPEADRPGSVGRPLPHARLRISDDGEILVDDPGFLGYLGEPPPANAGWPTGDLGRLDEDGYLHIVGRRKNQFVTAFGRNVAPEWVEAELTARKAIAQAAVFGEARSWNAAIIVSPAGDNEVLAAISAANANLPDYARIRRWLRAAEPFSPANGQATANGRLRRETILDRYREAIEALYESTTPEVTA